MMRRTLFFFGFVAGVFLVWYYVRNLRAQRPRPDLLVGQIVLPPTPSPSPETTASETVPQVEGYCVKCKTRRVMQDPKAVSTQAGRPAVRGVCPACGSRMFKLGRM